MKMFSVHDSKAEAYLAPIYFKSTGEAMRAFETSCQDQNSNFYKYPADFTLVELGEFDEQSASIATHAQPRILSNAAEFKK
nr:MAG: nonstructural protein [Microvirus sp.]